MTLIVIYTFDVYIPSNDSSIYQLHECDLFTELETQKTIYLNWRKVILLEDLMQDHPTGMIL